MIKTKASQHKMSQLLDQAGDLGIIKTSDLVEGKISSVSNNRVWVDIQDGKFIGIISGKELVEAGISMPNYKEGDKIIASVVEPENDEGFVLLSVREALRNKGWSVLEEKYNSQEIFKAIVIEANRGGLIIEAEGIKGFLPVSQLTPAHYPRVGSDKDEILSKLSQFEGKYFEVKIISLDKNANKLIFSEKAAHKEEFDKITSNIQVGEVIAGKVSGVVDFGIFVSFDSLEGLIHISEISWDKVSDPRSFAKVGDEIQVQVISIEGDKISLSIKRLLEDKWLDLIKDYKVGQVIKGTVTQIMPFGVFVKVSGQIDGLIHISELAFDHITDPTEVVKVDQELELKVIDIEPESHRFGLSLKAMQTPKADAKTKSGMTSDLSSLGLSDALIKKLKEAGIENTDSLKTKSEEEIKSIKGIGEKSAAKIIESLK